MCPPSRHPAIDLRDLRRRILTAVASDDVLVELLTLKGGNALELIHKIGERASLDLDFSMETDTDARDLEDRLKKAVTDRMHAAGYLIFDWEFGPRPSNGADPHWGGYRAEFKLIDQGFARSLGLDLQAMRRNAQVIGPAQERVFTIEISKFEFCRGRVPADVDHFTCHVYTPAMIASEKLRAICQQMPEYRAIRQVARRPRPRDFYDIHAIATIAAVRLATETDLVRHMFDAKQVPYDLVRLVSRRSEFDYHRQGWDAVVQAVRGDVKPFEFYFEFLCREAESLKALWIVDAPVR